MENKDYFKSWTSHTMTSENYLRIKGKYVHYGVESQDDEQAFNSYCLISEFIDSEADFWASVNFKDAQCQEIHKTIAALIFRNSPFEPI